MWNGTQLIGSSFSGNLSLSDYDGTTASNSSVPEDTHSDVFQHLYFRIPLILAYTIVFLCCFFGNLIVMAVVMLHHRMRTVTNFSLANFALADFCVGIFCVYQHLILYLTHSWILGDFLCRMYYFIQGLSYTASTFFLAIISLERYVVIVHPMWSKRFITLRRLRIALVILWLVSAIYNSPRFFLYGTINVPSSVKGKEYDTFCVIRRSVYNSHHFDLYNFAFLFVFPLTVMGILYTKIAIKLWRSQRLHGERVNSLLCCAGERQSKITRSMLSDSTSKKTSIKQVPVDCKSPEHEDTIITLHEEESVAFHEDATATLHEESCAPSDRTPDFESSGAEEEEEEENENDEEELLEDFKKESIKSFFSRKISTKRHSFSRSDSAQQQRGSFKSLKIVISEDVSNEIKSLPEATTYNNETEYLLKADLRLINKELDDNVPFNEESLTQDGRKEKLSSVEEKPVDEKSIPDDPSAPLTDNPSRFNSFQSHYHVRSMDENISHIRRGSDPPVYVSSKSLVRRCSEPISYVKSLLQRNQSENSPGLKVNKRVRRSGSKVLRSRRKIIRFLIVILCAFAICNLPHHARKFWQTWSSSYSGDSDTSLFVTISTTLFLYMNSGVNPFLYAFLSANFRKCIKDVLLLRTHLWTKRVYSPKSSNNSKSTPVSSRTSASRGSASSSRA